MDTFNLILKELNVYMKLVFINHSSASVWTKSIESFGSNWYRDYFYKSLFLLVTRICFVPIKFLDCLHYKIKEDYFNNLLENLYVLSAEGFF